MLMTTSDSDGEALNALRMANKLLAAEALRWPDVLQEERKVTVTVSREGWNGAPYKAEEEWVPPHLKDKVVIDLMFKTIYGTQMTPDFKAFLDNVHERWKKFGSLTANQYNAIRRCYSRARPDR